MTRSLSGRVFRILLLLYPAGFRESYGDEMEQAFLVALEAHSTRRRYIGAAYAWMRVLWDTVVHAASEHLQLDANGPDRWSGTYWESIYQDGCLSARRIRKTPGFTAVVVVTAAIGITVSTLVFTIINASILRPPPHVVSPDELVHIHREFASRGPVRVRVSHPDFLEIRDRSTTMVDVAAVIPYREFIVRIGSNLEQDVLGAEVSENYFQLLGRPLVLGGGLSLDDTGLQIEGVVIGNRLWQREYGGDRSVIGETMQIDGHTYTIVGVAPPSSGWGSESSSIEAAVWIPIKVSRKGARGGDTLTIVGRRHEDRTIEQVQAELDTIGPSLAARSPERWDDQSEQPARLVALTDFQSRIPVGARTIPSMIIYLVFVGLIMLVTCSNVANLLLNRALGRRAEIALRLSLGSGRGRLMRQLLIESIFLFGLAGSLSLLLIHWQTQLLSKGRGPYPFAVDITIDPMVVVFTLAVTVVSGVVFGLVPALQASRQDLMTSLKGTVKSGRPHWLAPRNLFVLAQVAGSMVLVVISALMVRDVQLADKLDIGFDTENRAVLSLDLSFRDYDDAEGRRFLEALTERLEGVAGVEQVATAGWVPLSERWWTWGGFVPEGYELGPDESLLANWNAVTPGYFDLMGMPFLEGRGFTEQDDAGAPGVVVVNQAFAERFWQGQDPVGRTMTLEDDGLPTTVVGVVRNAKYSRTDFADESTSAHFWLPRTQQSTSQMELHFKTPGDPTAVFGAVREQVRLLDSSLPIKGLSRIETVTAAALLEERLAAAMFGGLGLVSLFLAVLGIYGVIAHSVLERTRELGIRLALGARPTKVIGMVVTESLGMSAAGIVTGLILAAVATQGIRSLFLGIGTLDPISFLGSVVLLGLAAILASLIPAVRAARVDPALSLRNE